MENVRDKTVRLRKVGLISFERNRVTNIQERASKSVKNVNYIVVSECK